MMQVIPLRPLKNQTLQVQLAQQAVALNIYQLAYGLFVDVYKDNELVIGGVIAQNLNRIVRDAYLGLVGDFTFLDTQTPPGGVGEDPVYTGLGDRYQLVYLEAADLLNSAIIEAIPG